MADPAEKRDFEAALAVLRKGEFAGGADGLHRISSSAIPQSGYTPSALFWLGNAQYANRDYRMPSATSARWCRRRPSICARPRPCWPIANCQVELKDIKAARKTLEDLVKAYPAVRGRCGRQGTPGQRLK